MTSMLAASSPISSREARECDREAHLGAAASSGVAFAVTPDRRATSKGRTSAIAEQEQACAASPRRSRSTPPRRGPRVRREPVRLPTWAIGFAKGDRQEGDTGSSRSARATSCDPADIDGTTRTVDFVIVPAPDARPSCRPGCCRTARARSTCSRCSRRRACRTGCSSSRRRAAARADGAEGARREQLPAVTSRPSSTCSRGGRRPVTRTALERLVVACATTSTAGHPHALAP